MQCICISCTFLVPNARLQKAPLNCCWCHGL